MQRMLTIIIKIIMTLEIVRGEIEPIINDAPLLPYFNRGFTQVLTFKQDDDSIAISIGPGTIAWLGDNETIQLSVNYYCHTSVECYGEFYLNNSHKIVSIVDYSTGNPSNAANPGTYSAVVTLQSHRRYGFAIVGFKLTIRDNLRMRGSAYGQYLINLRPPKERVITQGCNFKVNAHYKVNLMALTFNPSTFMPSGLKWYKFVVYKQIRLKPPPEKSFLYVPLIIMTQTPFRGIPLNFYYFKEVIIELGDGSRLLIKGTTGDGLNLHDSGLYTVRWFTHDQQHMLDEQCVETAQVPFWTRPLPAGPLFAFARREQPEEWSFDIHALQNIFKTDSYREGLTKATRIVACVWPDAYQEIPNNRRFVLVITRRAFYSTGEQFGFLMYGYLQDFVDPGLRGFVCHTESMRWAGMAAYVPCPWLDKVTVYPSVAVNWRRLRFVIRGDFACRPKFSVRSFDKYEISVAGNTKQKAHGQFDQTVGDVCKNTYQSRNLVIWSDNAFENGTAFNMEFEILNAKKFSRIVLLDPTPGIQADPVVAIYAQKVKITCFEKRMQILHKVKIDSKKLLYIQLFGEFSDGNYVLIANYTIESGFKINTKKIHSSVQLNNTGGQFINLVLQTIAYHLYNYRGFRCRMKINNLEIPEYEESTTQTLCYVRQPQAIILTVDNITVPIENTEKLIEHQNLQIYQTSCIQPGSRVTFTCTQWSEIDNCPNLPTVDHYYNVDTDLIVYIPNEKKYIERKPVFDRLGKGRVEFPSVPLAWHQAEVACHRTIRQIDNSGLVLMDQYSSAVRLCVTQMNFKFYVTHVGFDLKNGLTLSLEELKHRRAVAEVSIGKVNKVDMGSAIICEVTEKSEVIHTEIRRLTAKGKDKEDMLRVYNYIDTSIAILIQTHHHKKNEFVDIYCQTRRKKSQIPAKSETLRLMVREAVLMNDGWEELINLFVYILTTILIGLVITACCPIIVMIHEKRMHRQKVRRRRIAAKKLKRIDYLRQIGLEKPDEAGKKHAKNVDRSRFKHKEHKKEIATEGDVASLPDEVSQQQQQTTTSAST